MAENIIVLGDLVGAPRVVAVDVEVRDVRGYAIHERLIYDVILRVVPCPNPCYFLFRHSEIVCLFAYIRDVFIVVRVTPNVEFAYQNRHAVVAPFGIPLSLHAQNITAQHVSNSAISAVTTFFITNPSIFTKNYSNI